MVKKRFLTKQEALERLKYLCASNERCLYDIRKKLSDWGLHDEFETISETLLNEKYINEERYAQSFVNDKVKFSKWGHIKIRYNLRMKGLDEKAINNAIHEFPAQEYELMVKKEVEKKYKSLKETDRFKKLQKIYSFSAQRGYEIDVVRGLLDDSD